jgi:hypothetical protein
MYNIPDSTAPAIDWNNTLPCSAADAFHLRYDNRALMNASATGLMSNAARWQPTI